MDPSNSAAVKGGRMGCSEAQPNWAHSNVKPVLPVPLCMLKGKSTCSKLVESTYDADFNYVSDITMSSHGSQFLYVFYGKINRALQFCHATLSGKS